MPHISFKCTSGIASGFHQPLQPLIFDSSLIHSNHLACGNFQIADIHRTFRTSLPLCKKAFFQISDRRSHDSSHNHIPLQKGHSTRHSSAFSFVSAFSCRMNHTCSSGSVTKNSSCASMNLIYSLAISEQPNFTPAL